MPFSEPTTTPMKHTIGFIGAGKMATAMCRGFVNAGLADPQSIVASARHESSRSRFSTDTGCPTVAQNIDVIATSDIVFLSVKPTQIVAVCKEIAPKIDIKRHLIVSVAAGVKIASMEAALPAQTPVIRVMPNTPCLVEAGAMGVSHGGSVSPEQLQLVTELLESVGLVAKVPESLIDAVTGLSGSGPAYVFQIIEALSDAGVRVGLPRDLSTQLAAQTLYGAAKMVLETGEHPAVLKDGVTSPGGTTIAGLAALESGGLRAALYNAVYAATNRSKELS
jgi:pyrroline-5-carboxylate reductase